MIYSGRTIYTPHFGEAWRLLKYNSECPDENTDRFNIDPLFKREVPRYFYSQRCRYGRLPHRYYGGLTGTGAFSIRCRLGGCLPARQGQ